MIIHRVRRAGEDFGSAACPRVVSVLAIAALMLATLGHSGSTFAQKPKAPAVEEEEEEAPCKSTKSPKSAKSPQGRAADEAEPKLKNREVQNRKRSTERKDNSKRDDDVQPEKLALTDENRVRVQDVVTCALSSGGELRARPVVLLNYPLNLPLPPGREYAFQLVSKDGVGRTPVRILGESVTEVQYYEQLVFNSVANTLGVATADLVSVGPKLVAAVKERPNKLDSVLAQLSEGIAEHDSGVTRNIRRGTEWKSMRQALVDAQFNIELAQAIDHARSGRSQTAIEAADQLATRPDRTSESTRTLRRLYEELFLVAAQKGIAERDYVTARQSLNKFLDRFPREAGPRADGIRQQLIAAAREMADRALKEKNPDLVEQAASVWPLLDDLQQLRRKLILDYPVLRVAYSELPRQFSPFGQITIPERHAIGLMFESLVRFHADQRSDSTYVRQLAASRPLPIARGCVFQLPKTVWSDSQDNDQHFCTAEDVRWTVQLLKSPEAQSSLASRRGLISDVEIVDSEHPSRLAIRLRQDYWQPLSAMDFPITPKASFKEGGTAEEHRRFAASPVGTGPYRLAKTNEQRTVRFEANPLCRRERQPAIKEIIFYQLDSIEAQDAFLKGKIDLIYAVRPESAVQLRGLGKNVIALPARNVHFLAPNYRSEVMKNAELRLAIAHAIDRNAILNSHFRAGKNDSDHAPLNGPFPTRSWASARNIPAYSKSQVEAYLSRARQSLAGDSISLNLIYPDKSAEIAKACEQIRKQLEEVGIRLVARPIAPEQFFYAVTGRAKDPSQRFEKSPALGEKASRQSISFDLVYWQHDFSDESYWIWPLFDPAERDEGGANFMGITPDDTLTTLFRDFVNHKQFRRVENAAHKIHEYIYRNATFIPLWELDTYVAVRSNLQKTQFDAVTLFHRVEEWQIRPES